jgi:predicted nucleic acid-binding Zn finger protein
MTTHEPTEVEGTDLDKRDVRALTECMVVLPEGGDIYTVVGENGGTYRVDGREGRCTCPDAEYNLPTDDGRETCKHATRVAYATGRRAVPAWVETTAVDPRLGEHTYATPRVPATDGGSDLTDASDASEVPNGGSDGDDRPDDCDCRAWDESLALPCWPCFRKGFETPASGD